MPKGAAHPGSHRPRRGLARIAAAVVILVAWGTGVGMLVRREYFVPNTRRLTEAALRISPGATFYVVEQGGKQVGFASNTIDTLPTKIDVTDYFVADLPIAGIVHRASARSVVRLSRALALRTFDVQVESGGTAMSVGGRADGDSAVVYALTTNGVAADSQRLAVLGPVLLPTLVPLAVSLGEAPRVGRKYSLPMFNPTTMSRGEMTLEIRAESLFTVVDSATFDQEKGEWVSVHSDTLRAWRVASTKDASSETGGFIGWVDAQGRMVQSTQPGGITLRRMAYEIAFQNWRIARDRAIAGAAGAGADDIQERTAIAAGALLGRSKLTALSVRLGAVDLRGYDLNGGRQRLAGDTLYVRREGDDALAPGWSLAARSDVMRLRFRRELSEEPLLQVGDSRISALAVRIAGLDRDPRVVAEKVNRWVHDSLRKEATFSVPNAVEVLRTRTGDCNEHTQLYVALARAAGIPARIATGLAYVNGKFYYHAWPEVYLKGWVAVDPTFGEFPADAAHLRFVIGGLARQAELFRLIGTLKIQVVEAR
ncbi:MAG: transglutaminase family protein [Gemmatimonadales bacterium]